MASSNDDLSAILIAVRNDVMRETQRRQVPWEHSSLTSRVYFKTSPGGVVPPPPPLQANPGAAEKSQIALEQGRAAYQKGDFYRAIADLNEAIRLDPKSVAAFNHRGMAYNDKGDFNRAIVDYSEVTRLNPRWAGAFNNRGFTYKNKNDFDRAIADYNEAIKLDAKYATAFFNWCYAYLVKKDLDKAMADCDEAIREVVPLCGTVRRLGPRAILGIRLRLLPLLVCLP